VYSVVKIFPAHALHPRPPHPAFPPNPTAMTTMTDGSRQFKTPIFHFFVILAFLAVKSNRI
jgi:hypothetical protein